MKKKKIKISKLQKNKENPYSRYWRNKCLTRWSNAVRERDGGCVICGAKTTADAHHLLPKEYFAQFSTDIMNGVSLCKLCHKYSHRAAHRNAFYFVEMINQKSHDQYIWVMSRIYDKKVLMSEYDWEKAYNKLMEEK